MSWLYRRRKMSENIEQNNELQDLNELLKVRRAKLSELQNNDKDPFKIVKFDVNCSAKHIVDNFDEMEGKLVSIAGRIMSKRGMGKAGFCNLQDRDGKIQLYVRVDEIGAENYSEFKKFDIGDIVGSTEADPSKFKISNESPVGSALIGKKIGDTVDVAVPDGVISFKILEIHK